MKIAQILALRFAMVLAFGLPLTDALSQQTQSIAGTYAIVSVQPFGTNPTGQMILGTDGRYSLLLARNTLPKIAAGVRDKGTPEENQAIVAGSIAHFGTYTVDVDKQNITFNIEASTFPNWNGVSFKRALKVSGDQLTYINSAPSNGGQPNEVVWKRLK